MTPYMPDLFLSRKSRHFRSTHFRWGLEILEKKLDSWCQFLLGNFKIYSFLQCLYFTKLLLFGGPSKETGNICIFSPGPTLLTHIPFPPAKEIPGAGRKGGEGEGRGAQMGMRVRE